MPTKMLIVIFTVIFLISCSKEKSGTESLEAVKTENSTAVSTQPPSVDDVTKTKLLALQKSIMLEPESRQWRVEYCNYSASNPEWIITVGSGRLVNPETGGSIPQHYALRAAQIDAARWALYAQTWISDNFDQPFGSIKGQSTAQPQALFENTLNDSLVVFFAFKR